MKYELAIFDMDGTILDTIEDLAQAVNFALSECGFKKRTIAEVISFVGNGVRKLIERSVPDKTSADVTEKVLGLFLDYYMQNCDVFTKPYNGIPEAIKALRENGIKTAIVSNKADSAVQKLYKKYFDGMFDYVSGAREDIKRKPHPDMVDEVLEKLGVCREKTVFIGDSDVDVKTAMNAGISAVLVDWGFRSREVLIEAGAEIIVSDADAMLEELTE